MQKIGVAQPEDNPSAYHFKKKPLFGFTGDAFESHEDKRGVIADHHPQLHSKLGLDETTWLTLASRFEVVKITKAR